MKNIFNFKIFVILVLLISISIVIKIEFLSIIDSSAYIKIKHLTPNKLKYNIKKNLFSETLFYP